VVSLRGQSGELELFVNAHCAINPREGEGPFPVRTERIANGSTSRSSNCAMPQEHPDSSGTGIPDVIQLTLSGDPSDPATARFPSDTMTPVLLKALDGRPREVRPVTAPTATLDGSTFPTGLFSFNVTRSVLQ
jgi:hypothetical protein